MTNENIIGIIYSLPKNLIERMSENRNIFAKYIRGNRTRLINGNKLFIYESGSSNEIPVGTIINNVFFMTLSEIIERFNKKTIATKEELKIYASGRKSKKLLVLELKEIKHYNTPKKLKSSINMGGRYVTVKNKNQLFEI